MAASKVLPPTYLLMSLLVMVALHVLLPAAYVVPPLWNLVGLAAIAVGIAFNIVADNAFHKADTTVKPFVESTVLLTDGPFRFSRNPMYLGFVLVLIGVAVLLGSLTPFLVVPIFAVLMDRVFITAEEQMLEATFGQTWRDYRKTTRRWI